MKKYSKNPIIDEFLKKGDRYEKALSEIADMPYIKNVLNSYGKGPNDIKDIFWKLMATGSGEQVAYSVISNPRLLEEYLKMKSKNISDLEAVVKLSDLLNE